jgi:hypothetical protein
MRLVLAMVFAVLVALPLSASAQAEESEEAPKQAVEQEPASPAEPSAEEPVRGVRRWHPEAFTDPSKPASEPALKLEVDSTALEVTPTAPPTLEELERQEKKKRRRRAIGIGVGVTLGAFIVGSTIAAAVALPW